MPRNVAILGSTGSIGTQTLEVIDSLGDDVRVVGLAARGNVDLVLQQARKFHPQVLCITGPIPEGLSLPDTEIWSGEAAMANMACLPHVDLVVVATSGRAGLEPTLAALAARKLVALANKETLVMAGPVIARLLSEGQGQLIPIDSEHSAIWQCLQGESPAAISRLSLTASGGALRNLPPDALAAVTPEQALRHPTWDMGKKITIDCANLMNKGLEVIEAHWLFDVPFEHIDVILHPESIVHSLVTFRDGSVKAQLGLPDMRIPIQYAMSHPERWPTSRGPLDLKAVGSLTFAEVERDRYPALELALEAGRKGGTYPAVLSAADEVAVDAFIVGAIAFTDIPEIVAGTLDAHESCSKPDLDHILEADSWARDRATRMTSKR